MSWYYGNNIGYGNDDSSYGNNGNWDSQFSTTPSPCTSTSVMGTRLGQDDGDSQSMHFNGDGDSVQAQAGDSPGDSQLRLESESELEIDEWPEDDPSDNEAVRIKEEDDRIGEMLPHLFAPGWDAFLSQDPVPAKTMTNTKVKQIIKDKGDMKVVKMQMKAQKAAKAKNSGQQHLLSSSIG